MHFSLLSKSSFLHSPSQIPNKQSNKHVHTTEQRVTHYTLPSMADSTPYTKPHFPLSRIQPKPTNQGKSCSGFIIKVLFLALFIIVLPLFPSQAPDFVSQTILNKFWELLHLLFIGIAVTYGLFSRRNSELDTHVEIETTLSSADDNATAPSYVSKVFPVSTIFDDGYENENAIENPCGVDEKRMKMMMHCWNPQYFDAGAGVVSSNGGGTVGVFDEQYKTHLPVSEHSFGYSSLGCDGNGTNVVQAWNSEYYHSEPVVVVAQPNYNTGECGEVVDYKPLGLPIRSLRSVARDVDSPKYANESDSSLGSRGSSRASDKSGDKEFGDLGPSNSEKQFSDAGGGGGSASPIPWRSRNRRMDREKIYDNDAGHAHFRPLSVDETRFETPFFSSHNMYSSLDSISTDNINAQEEELRQLRASYVSASEKKNFQQEDVGQMKSSFVSVSEIMNFLDEDVGTRKASYDSTSENTSFQKIDLGKKIFHGSSSKNRRMGIKGKYGAASFPSHFRPMSVDETQFDSLGSKSFESGRPFSSHTRIYSSLDSISSDMDFQEEDMGQKTSHMHTTENMNFEEENMGQKKTSYLQASENVNFQMEDMEQKQTAYVPASENINFQEVDLGKKNFQMSSRNGMLESKGKYVADSRSSHLRPMPVDETQLELLSSRSFQSMGSFSSQSSLSSSLDSVLSENMNLEKEDIGEKKSSHGSSSSSPSPLARRNSEASLQAFQAQGYSNGSSLPDDIKNSLNNDDLRSLNEIGGEDHPSNKESWIHALHSDTEKPASLAKAPSRGKSVRTRRTSGVISGTMRIGETSSKQSDEKVEKNVNNVESVLKKDKMKSAEPDLPLKGVSKKTLDFYCPKPEIKFSNHRTRDKLEETKNLSKQDSDIELENTRMSSDESGVPEFVNDSDLDSEVDKKASEFIAKFKAQIRLQKMGSIDRAKEQKIIGNKMIR